MPIPATHSKATPVGHLSTHVLDAMNGRPAAGLAVKLQRIDGDKVETLRAFELNADGRNEGGALLNAQTMAVGRDRLVFSVASYCRGMGVMLPEPPFIDDVQLDSATPMQQGITTSRCWSAPGPVQPTGAPEPIGTACASVGRLG